MLSRLRRDSTQLPQCQTNEKGCLQSQLLSLRRLRSQLESYPARCCERRFRVRTSSTRERRRPRTRLLSRAGTRAYASTSAQRADEASRLSRVLLCAVAPLLEKSL